MAGKTHQTPLGTRDDIGTGYTLIATGVGAVLIALIYLILI